MPGAEEQYSDLLEVAANFAEGQGAERIFVRVPDVWRLLELTRRSGFLPCVRVLTLALRGRAVLLGQRLFKVITTDVRTIQPLSFVFIARQPS